MQVLPDIQMTGDTRGVAIDRVGVSGLRFPIEVLDRQHGTQRTIATLAMSVSLPEDVRGTHMSRFIEQLAAYDGTLSTETLPTFLRGLAERLDAAAAQIEVSFPLFVDRPAPVSGKTAPMDYACTLRAEVDLSDGDGGLDHVEMVVAVPVASLCPCSREISDYGAHNQRGEVEITIRPTEPGGTPEMIWFEEAIEYAEQSASAPLYPLLKRSDERHVTMQAYDNPAFVEDILRNTAVRLRGDDRIQHFAIKVTNFESIHNHNAFAEVAWTRPADQPARTDG
jgi:GTP cyclohydrolase I